MGGGASLDKDQNILLTRELKTEYENIAKNHPDWNDETIKGLLEQKYQEIVARFQKPLVKSPEKSPEKHQNVASPVPIVKKEGQRGGGIKAVPQKKTTLRPDKGGTRRRSFGDEKDKMPKAAAAAAVAIVNSLDKITPGSPVALAQSQSTPLIESVQPTAPAVDSWDSVDQQPYCKLCAMAFKTISFLERHVKYSDMHAKALKKQTEAEASSHSGENNDTNKLQEKQQEGVHYRMLYSGSKLFWRTQETIDIDMYYHIIPDTVEIIFFDESKGRELPRLYLNHTVLMNVVNAIVDREVTEKIELIKKDQQHDKFSKIDIKNDKMIMELPDMKEFIDDTRRKTFTTYILSRLQLNNSEITHVSNAGDDSNLQIVLPIQPNGLIPVPVHRRRRTNSDEINKALTNLEGDRLALKAATGKAERIADFIHQSISLFANSKNIYKGLSVPRKRWVFAIRKTILLASLKKTKVRLEEIRIAKEKKDAAEKLGGRKRSIVRPKEI